MSETQPRSGDSAGTPATPPDAEQLTAGPSRAPRPPLPPERRPIVWPSFALGFLAPVAALALGYVVGVGIRLPEQVPLLLGMAAGLAVWVALLFAIEAGRAKSDDSLRSLGLGGLATVAIPGLGVLLLFGTCVIDPMY